MRHTVSKYNIGNYTMTETKQKQDEWRLWRDGWISSPSSVIVADENEKPPPSSSEGSSSNGLTKHNGENSLELARLWISTSSKPQHVAKLVKSLFREQRDIAAKPQATRSAEIDKGWLRQIEWHVILILELWIHYGDPVLDATYPHIILSGKKKKKFKKLPSAVSISEKRTTLLNHLTNILSRAAFFVPVQQSLGEYLTAQCLTKRIWKRMPTVVTYILDQFEVANPHLPKEEDAANLLPTRKKKKKSANKKSEKKARVQIAMPRPRLLAQKKSRFGGSHFHRSGCHKEISKLLDTTPVNSNKSFSARSKLVTPRTVSGNKKKVISTVQQNTRSGSGLGKNSTNTTKVLSSKSNTKRSKTDFIKQRSVAPTQIPTTTAKKKSQTQISAPETPLTKKRPRSTSFSTAPETPMMTPVSQHKKPRNLTVSETPINQTSIGETPLRKSTKVDETPQQIVAETPLLPQQPMLSLLSPIAEAVQPMKLFATLKPRQQPPQIEKKAPPSSSPGRLRPTSKVLTAARAYLSRNSSSDT